MTDGDDTGDSGVVKRTFDTDQPTLTLDVTETIAELEGRDSDALTPLYDRVGHLIDHLYTTPPRSDADVKVSFTYEGFRVTLYQDGRARFRELR